MSSGSYAWKNQVSDIKTEHEKLMEWKEEYWKDGYRSICQEMGLTLHSDLDLREYQHYKMIMRYCIQFPSKGDRYMGDNDYRFFDVLRDAREYYKDNMEKAIEQGFDPVVVPFP